MRFFNPVQYFGGDEEGLRNMCTQVEKMELKYHDFSFPQRMEMGWDWGSEFAIPKGRAPRTTVPPEWFCSQEARISAPRTKKPTPTPTSSPEHAVDIAVRLELSWVGFRTVDTLGKIVGRRREVHLKGSAPANTAWNARTIFQQPGSRARAPASTHALGWHWGNEFGAWLPRGLDSNQRKKGVREASWKVPGLGNEMRFIYKIIPETSGLMRDCGGERSSWTGYAPVLDTPKMHRIVIPEAKDGHLMMGPQSFLDVGC
ncbi:uncharacterized protein PAC_01206 [Phialocephala subalpina]|uniref:Uncharacterized protein n=1 Tax=Phialocephala subalpina TaxID=576137 RepID=A0A1L7WEX3_9HELO|nr:uncharacterized protein PAC_01206 [Phialocephala subalpina]